MDALIRAGGLYNGHGHPIADRLLPPYTEVAAARRVWTSFHEMTGSSTETAGPDPKPDLILCLPIGNAEEMDVPWDDVAEIVSVLDRGGVVTMGGDSRAEAQALFEQAILPLLGGGRA